jgi:hypothetical protein
MASSNWKPSSSWCSGSSVPSAMEMAPNHAMG